MGGVGDDTLPSVEPDGVNASLQKAACTIRLGKAFAGPDELVLQLAGQFAESGDRRQQPMELFELSSKQWPKSLKDSDPARASSATCS